jgi:hypothetical protein
MISLSDVQLETVIRAAASLEPERRDIFLQRVGAMLALRRRGNFNDDDVANVAAMALCGLIQHADTAA